MLDKARIEGEVHYRLLEIAVGAEINGKLIHLGDADTAKPASEGKSPGAETDE